MSAMSQLDELVQRSGPKRKHWHYQGDVNIEHGGMYYCLDGFDQGYAECVRVTPCSNAGGPDNTFWIEQLTVDIGDHALLAFSGVGPDAATRRADRVLRLELNAPGDAVSRAIIRIEAALTCRGWDTQLDKWDKLTEAQRRHVIVDACVSYGRYDQQSSEMVSVGKPEFTRNREGDWEPAITLRANANLREYVRGRYT